MSSADLAARQQALLAAISARSDASGLAGLPGVEGGIERGLLAYRLNAQALSAKTLSSVFPRLREEMGEASFDAMAWAFWRAHPPLRGDLGLWGAELAGFLAEQDGMEAEPCELARLEWACHEAERAADAALDIGSLDLLATQEPSQIGLSMRPGLVLLRQSSGSWLVWRRQWRAESRALPEAEALLMQALLDGVDLESALAAAMEAYALFDFSAWFQTALTEGWLQAAHTLATKEDR